MGRMIRRFAWLLLSVMLAFPAAGPAEQAPGVQQPAVTPSATAGQIIFRFRDGIRWGMTPEQVKILEPEPMKERARLNWTVLMTDEKVAVSRFTADLLFMFMDNRLQIIVYELKRENPENDFRYLTGALSAVYGEQAEADPLAICNLMDAINPNHYRFDLITKAVSWKTGDGTVIYQFFYSGNEFAVMYVSAEQGTGQYQINGL